MSSRRSSSAHRSATAAAAAEAPRSASDGKQASTRKRKFTGPTAAAAADSATKQTPVKPVSRTRQSSAGSVGSGGRTRRQPGSFAASPTIDSSDSDSNDVEMADASPDQADEVAESTPTASRTKGAAQRQSKAQQTAKEAQLHSSRDSDEGDAEDEYVERKSAAADEGEQMAQEVAAAGSASEDEEGGEYAYDAHENRPSELLSPSVHALEQVDERDAFGSAERRATALAVALSPMTRPASLPGLEAEQALLSELLARTLHASQNNAALLLGPRGCGKSALLDVCLARLRADLQAEGKSFVVVRLSGLVQSDDTLAMRAIVAQLAADHELEPLRPGADFHALLAFLHEILAQGSFDSLPIFFVLDDFHAFVARAKQTLLYNLCDLLQSSRAQMALIGLTTHLDCYERLEKRIRSRMSHRRILVGAQAREAEREAAAAAAAMDGAGVSALPAPSPADMQREAMDNLLRVLRARLELGVAAPSADADPAIAAAAVAREPEEKKQPGSKRKTATAASGSASAAAASSALAPSPSASPFASAHNVAVAALLSPVRSPRLHARLALLLSLGRSTAFFLRAARLATCAALGPNHPHLLEEDLLWALEFQDRDWTTAALADCTELELTLLVSLLQLSRRHITHRNFTLLYSTYHSFYVRATAGQLSSLPLYVESAAIKAFEGLLAAGSLLVWADGAPSNPSAGATQGDPLFTGRAVQRRFAPVRMRVTEQELLHALKSRAVAAPTWLVQWATKGSAE